MEYEISKRNNNSDNKNEFVIDRHEITFKTIRLVFKLYSAIAMYR